MATKRRADVVAMSLYVPATSQVRLKWGPNEVSMERRQDVYVVHVHDALLERRNDVSRRRNNDASLVRLHEVSNDTP